LSSLSAGAAELGASVMAGEFSPLGLLLAEPHAAIPSENDKASMQLMAFFLNPDFGALSSSSVDICYPLFLENSSLLQVT
jgi:hypothetical protein